MLHRCSADTSGGNCISWGLLRPPPLQQTTGAAVTAAQSGVRDLCVRYSCVGFIIRAGSPHSFLLMAKLPEWWHVCLQLTKNTQLLLSQVAKCQEAFPRCGDKH